MANLNSSFLIICYIVFLCFPFSFLCFQFCFLCFCVRPLLAEPSILHGRHSKQACFNAPISLEPKQDSDMENVTLQPPQATPDTTTLIKTYTQSQTIRTTLRPRWQQHMWTTRRTITTMAAATRIRRPSGQRLVRSWASQLAIQLAASLGVPLVLSFSSPGDHPPNKNMRVVIFVALLLDDSKTPRYGGGPKKNNATDCLWPLPS